MSPSRGGEDGDNDPEVTLGSINKHKTINFSIRAQYTAWEPREAFRELVQNWRDGIIKSFSLSESEFTVIREEIPPALLGFGEVEVTYKVPGKNGQRALGYIRFKCNDVLGNNGTVEITNRSATLQPWHLDLGGTSKSSDDKQAGVHGEGLKLALLVLMRGNQNHNVRCVSGEFNWKFNFTTRGRLAAYLSRMSAQDLEAAETEASDLYQSSSVPFAPCPVSDVRFIIGETGKGRNEKGAMVNRAPVQLEEFEAWTQAALFLHNKTDGFISTKHGTLITDPAFAGNIYLKGFLLNVSTPARSASITNLPLKFGYDFATGNTNRERQSLASAYEETGAIIEIWTEAVKSKPALVSQLSDMLNSDDPEYADVFKAHNHTRRAISKALRDYLIGGQFANKWYYSDQEKDKNNRLESIIQGLGHEGVRLRRDYWSVFQDHSLLHTAEEEEYNRFQAAPKVESINTEFGKAVQWQLRACLRANFRTRGIALDFVQAGNLHLRLYYDSRLNKISVHSRWLSVSEAIKEMSLPQDLDEADVVFHVVRKLFAEAILHTGLSESEKSNQTTMAEQRLLDYMRIEVKVEKANPGLCLTWAVNSRRQGNSSLEIQCHDDSTCSRLKDSLLISEDAQKCNLECPMTGACKTSTHFGASHKHFETNLQSGREYFFVVRKTSDLRSFVRISSVMACPPRSPIKPVDRGPGPFTLGKELVTVDLLAAGKNKWYEGKDPNNVKAIIGILPKDSAAGNGESAAKRRKLN